MEPIKTSLGSEVMTEFYKIASKMATAEDKKVIEDKTVESKEDMIEKAHPNPVYVAEAQGVGGLVENQNEQHDKIVNIVNKMPSGLLVHTYAACAIELIKLAKECEDCGEKAAAETITTMAEKILDNLPLIQAPKQNG